MHAHPAPRRQEKIPNVLLKAMGALVLASLLMVTAARVAGLQPAATPDDSVAVVAERLLVIESTLGGGAVISGPDGSSVARLGPEEAGFINGVHRALSRERMLSKIEGNPPVRIVRFADGRLGLRDPATDWRVELISFGDDNRDAFAALLN